MNIYVQTQGFNATPAMEAHVRKQLSRNLASAEDHIMAVDIFLGDINGPKGGVDKKAGVCVQLASRDAIRVEVVHTDLYAAITIAARKSKRAVKRTVQRHKRVERRKIRHLRHFQGELAAG